jgi:hypothetical protein
VPAWAPPRPVRRRAPTGRPPRLASTCRPAGARRAGMSRCDRRQPAVATMSRSRWIAGEVNRDRNRPGTPFCDGSDWSRKRLVENRNMSSCGCTGSGHADHESKRMAAQGAMAQEHRPCCWQPHPRASAMARIGLLSDIDGIELQRRIRVALAGDCAPTATSPTAESVVRPSSSKRAPNLVARLIRSRSDRFGQTAWPYQFEPCVDLGRLGPVMNQLPVGPPPDRQAPGRLTREGSRAPGRLGCVARRPAERRAGLSSALSELFERPNLN